MSTIESRLFARPDSTPPQVKRKKTLKLDLEQQATIYKALLDAGTPIAGPDWASMTQGDLAVHSYAYAEGNSPFAERHSLVIEAATILDHLIACRALANDIHESTSVRLIL